MFSAAIICALAVAAAENENPLEFVIGADGKVHITARLSDRTADNFSDGPITQQAGQAVLRLQLRGGDGVLNANIFATYRKEKRSLILSPRFGLVPGQNYVATLFRDGRAVATRLYRVPVKYDKPAPVVTEIFPTVRVVPANHLKFYIHFSQPMREGREIFEKIKLFDAMGEQIGDPWRRRELWNTDATRLTLWIHPGRVKTGVNLRSEEGPVLIPSQQYTLRFTGDLKGADGQSLRPHKKAFSTAAEDRKRPLPIEWKLASVRSGTRQPLRVNFGEPLDAALAKRSLRVYGPDGKPVGGTIKLEKNETCWIFTPAGNWLHADYRLIIDPELEDLAGNTPVRVFDTDLREKELQPAVLDLGFRPRP